MFIDQHFLKRGRIGRMLPMLAARGDTLGLGVEEDSAAVLQGDTVEIIGRALLVNLADARSDGSLGGFNIAQARLSLLGSPGNESCHPAASTSSHVGVEGARADGGRRGCA